MGLSSDLSGPPVPLRFSIQINPSSFMSSQTNPAKELNILVIKGQGIGPECVDATKAVLAATGLAISYTDGSLGYPDAQDLFPKLQQFAPEVYATEFGTREAGEVATTLEREAKEQAQAGGNINDFYKKLLAKLSPKTLLTIKAMVLHLEQQTLKDASQTDAVLKGALRTLDEGDEPSRNVTIRKGFEQYANIRRCITLDPIAPGMPGVDLLFVRENVEDLYASIEHRLARNYPQALRHQTPEGCELICRAAFEAAFRDGRKKVTGLEKPNILKITGGLFKESFMKVAKDYSSAVLGDRGIEANFMIIDDGLAAIAATPERFDVVVTTNMFGDIGSDIAAKVTGGVGLVSSNNTNPNNPTAVSMFETMGGTADDIAGHNKANPVALIDAAAEMLLHIGGPANIRAAELIKTAILEVLADGHYVGDIKKGPFQTAKNKERSGTREFAAEIAVKVQELIALKQAHPQFTIKELAIRRADSSVHSLFERALRSYEQFSTDMQPGGEAWEAFVERNAPPNPVRANSKILGLDMFVDDSGLRTVFTESGEIDEEATGIDPDVKELFERENGIELSRIFQINKAGSLQSIRSYGQYSSRVINQYLVAYPENGLLNFEAALQLMNASEITHGRFSPVLKSLTLAEAAQRLSEFDCISIKLIQAFYRVRASQITPVLKEHGFKLLRITSRGTEIYPTMCDFEKRDVDRYRVEIDEQGPLANEGFNHVLIQSAILEVQMRVAKMGWILSETMLNRTFIDGEGDKFGKEVAGVSKPYGMNLGTNYSAAIL
jgi:isocitrate/isopropylmalate dehydrogenase